MGIGAVQFVVLGVILLEGGGQASQHQDNRPVALDPLMSTDIQSFGLAEMLGESSLDDPPTANDAKPAPAPVDSAAPAPAPAPKVANQKAELQMAEVEWKDAYDSTVAPGKLKMPITKLPNASDRTWMKQIVESVKKGHEKQDIAHAKAALVEAQHIMQDSPKDEANLPSDEGGHLAATIAEQEKSTNNLKEIVKKFTADDPVTQDAQKQLEKSQQQAEEAEQTANAAKAQLEAKAKEAQDKLAAEESKDTQQVEELTKAKKEGTVCPNHFYGSSCNCRFVLSIVFLIMLITMSASCYLVLSQRAELIVCVLQPCMKPQKHWPPKVPSNLQ